MMSGAITGELQAVAAAFACGAAVTFVYDVLRIFRRVIPHGNLWIGMEDAFFWIWTAFWTFGVLYRENDGSFRGYMLLAMAAGMIAYHGTVSAPFVEYVGKILKSMMKFLIFPIKKLRKKLKNLSHGIIMKFTKHQKEKDGRA